MNFLDIISLEATDLEEILFLARESPMPILKGEGVALIFEKPSLRTRNSSEMAVVDLGGHPVYIQDQEVGFNKRESTRDIARVLASYYRVVAARVHSHDVLLEMADAIAGERVDVPVVNLLSDKSHPCQAVADVLTISNHFASMQDVIVTYVGDSNNVARSLAQACAILGSTVRIASPDEYKFDDVVKNELASFGRVEFFSDPVVAASGADVIYTDTWTSMGDENQADARRAVFAPSFTVDAKTMSYADSEAIFMHCLPAHRGEEVSNEVIESKSSVVFEQAANRRDAFRGILRKLCATS